MFIVELIESHKADDILSKYFVGIDSDGRVNFDYPDGLDQGQLEEGLR
jgi:hypothetical protein